MKKLIVKIALMALFIAPLGQALPAGATTLQNWNVTGHFVVAFELDGIYSHDMNLVQNSLGNLTGNGGYPAGEPYTYHWNITSGNVSSDQINITAAYDVGAPDTIMHMTGTIAPDGTMFGVWDDNYGGNRNGTWSTTSGVAVALSAEDFGVVNYDTGSGLGVLKGYTAGFGLTNATFAGVQSVVVQLFAGPAASPTLLQTNTATAKVGTDITGSQISSPFDVSGNFNYGTDGYWINSRESQYGQSLAATKVVATVTLADGKIVTAENTNLTGDPTTIFNPAAPVITSPANGATIASLALMKVDWTDITGSNPPFTYQYQAFSDPGYTAMIYDSGMTLTTSEIPTLGTPPGIYYLRVMGQDSLGAQSDWSNGTGNVYKITVVNIRPNAIPPRQIPKPTMAGRPITK